MTHPTGAREALDLEFEKWYEQYAERWRLAKGAPTRIACKAAWSASRTLQAGPQTGALAPGMDPHWVMTQCNWALLAAKDGAVAWRDGLQIIATKAAEIAAQGAGGMPQALHLSRPCYSPDAILARAIQKGADCDDDEALDMARDAVREMKLQGYIITPVEAIKEGGGT